MFTDDVLIRLEEHGILLNVFSASHVTVAQQIKYNQSKSVLLVRVFFCLVYLEILGLVYSTMQIGFAFLCFYFHTNVPDKHACNYYVQWLTILCAGKCTIKYANYRT